MVHQYQDSLLTWRSPCLYCSRPRPVSEMSTYAPLAEVEMLFHAHLSKQVATVIIKHPRVPWCNGTLYVYSLMAPYCIHSVAIEHTKHSVIGIVISFLTFADSILQLHKGQCTVSVHCTRQWWVQPPAAPLP